MTVEFRRITADDIDVFDNVDEDVFDAEPVTMQFYEFDL